MWKTVLLTELASMALMVAIVRPQEAAPCFSQQASEDYDPDSSGFPSS